MSSALRSAVVFAFVSALAVMTVPGCSQQGEGERCDSAKNGDEDCDSGLTCVRSNELSDGITDRCCPAEGSESDKRCTRGTPPTSSGGSGSAGSASAGTGGASAGTGGASAGTGGASGGTGGASGGEPAGGGGAASGGESTGGAG
jgi:hypothetical protein